MQYTEQMLETEDKEFLFQKHLGEILQNFDAISKREIKNKLLNLRDIITRYSFVNNFI